MGSSPNQFQLQRGRWYAAQFLGSEFEPDAGHAYSPIKVLDVRPLKTGQGLLELTFHHENYPEGVQSKQYQLRMIAHDPTFVFSLRLGASGDDRYLLITDLTWAWLSKHFNIPAQRRDVQDWQMSKR